MRSFVLALTVALVVAACGGDDDDAATTDAPPGTEVSATDPPPTDPPGTDPPATDLPATDPPATDPPATDPPATEPAATDPPATDPPVEAAAWIEIDPGSADCLCSDGSEFTFFERPGDPTKVMFYFQGGGACFNDATCDPNGDPTYTMVVNETTESLAGAGGLFDVENPLNPLSDYSVVYVPYCTGDVHLGDARHEYTPEIVIEHRGAVNAMAALDHLVEQYPTATEVFVTGASAGSVPTPLMGALTADRLPDARVTTFGDSSGAYPDVPGVNELIGELWGTTENIPDWPVNEGLTAADWSFPGLYIQSGLHRPDVTYARFDFAFDGVQATFAALAGVGSDAVVEQIDATEAQVEAAGVPLATYVAPGTGHVVAFGDAVYDMEVEGVRLIDWITELVDGGVPDDVHCVECMS